MAPVVADGFIRRLHQKIAEGQRLGPSTPPALLADLHLVSRSEGAQHA
jgi:hypothetical protein